MTTHPGLTACLFLFIYFLPWLSAKLRRHRNASAIALLNLLLGWTVLGWIVAAVWASTDNVAPKQPKAART